ncbi:MAG: hypothetical protein JSR45_02450 [Proteobacteria bacterium]|nr:hypothetical protein [Pseudomonadota bacterium]
MLFAVDADLGYDPYRVAPAYDSVRLLVGSLIEVGPDGKARVRDPRAVRRLGAQIDIVASDSYQDSPTADVPRKCGPGWCIYYLIDCNPARTACSYHVALRPGPADKVYYYTARITATSRGARHKAEANVMLFSESLQRPVATLSDLNSTL